MVIDYGYTRDGDGKTFPHSEVLAHVVGRLPSGCVFESSEGKVSSPDLYTTPGS